MNAVVTTIWRERQATLVEMFSAGKTMVAIAAHFGCTKGQIAGQIHRLRKIGAIPGGVKTKEEAGNAKVVFTESMDADLRDHLASGATYKDFALIVGVSQNVVRRRADALGIKSAMVSTIDWSVLGPTALAMRAEGHSFRVIAASLGVSQSSMRRMADAFELPRRLPAKVPNRVPHGPRERFWNSQRQDLVVKLLSEGLTYAEMVEQIGPGATINGITNLVHRLKGASPEFAAMVAAKREQPKRRVARPREPREKKPRKPRAPRVVVKIDKPARPAVDRPVGFEAIMASFNAPADKGVSFADVNIHFQCLWPFTCDDGETRYCGAAATEGSWCSHHAARVFSGTSRPSVATYKPSTGGRGFSFQRESRA